MKILFQGDSITDAGRSKNETWPNAAIGSGYVTMIAGHLLAEDSSIDIYNRGIFGNRTEDLSNRWDEDTLSFDYDVLSLLCGINDVGFDLRKGIRGDRAFVEPIYDKMIYRAKEKNPDAKIILMQPFVMKYNYNWEEFGTDIYDNYDTWYERVSDIGDMVSEIAKKYKAEFIPLFDTFKEILKHEPVERYTVDCVHLTSLGHAVIAKEWLKAYKKLGF